MNAKPDYEVNAELEQLRVLLRRMNEEYGPWVLLEEVRRLAAETENGQDALNHYAGVDRSRAARAEDGGSASRQKVIRKRSNGADAWERALRSSTQTDQPRSSRGENDAVAEARRLLGG